MPIYSYFIMNKNAGMVFAKDYASIRNEFEKTFNYPLEIKLDKYGCVKFGAHDQIKLGHHLLSVNGQQVYLDKMDKNKLKIDDLKGSSDLLEYLNESNNYPLALKFGKQQLSTNDKLVLTGRFFGLYSLAWQLAPVAHSSGIEVIETDLYRLYCYHTITGLKFIAIADSRQQNVELFLRKTYEIYSDYALKNPWYIL